MLILLRKNMFNKEQLVKVKWNGNTRKHYEALGYIFTKANDDFYVKACDLFDTSKTKVRAVCDYCGEEYESSYCVIKNAINKGELNACKHCASQKVNIKNAYIRIERNYSLAIAECNKRGYELITPKDELTTVCMYITIKTPSVVTQVWLDNFIRGHDCLVESYKNRDYSRIDKSIIKQTISDDGNVWCNENEYTNCTDRCLKIRCKCGKHFTTSYINYKKAGVRRCPTCVAIESSGEIEVRKALDELRISYEPEKRFKDCRDKKPLPFDFYIKDYNLVIEFDGQNHFYEVFPTHDITIAHDKIKNEYCKQNNINILRIPYWDGHNVKEIISNKIKELNLKI